MKVARPTSHDLPRLARCLGACLLIVASLAAGAQPAHVQSLVGRQAPAFTRRDLAGKSIRLDSLRGKVVLLNFWATWCAPCQTEMPVFAAWQREYGPQGFQVIGISMDDDQDTARKLVEKLRISYPVAMGDAKLGEQYGEVLGLPKTFLIGRDGKVLAEFQGETDLKAMEAKLKAALSGE
ncbi:MAG: TlpA family protein disulfide reductase [Terracidiphilus sp.]